MGPAKTDIAVIGAGISGLCAAHWLKKPGFKVRVLEKDSEPGGTMKTLRRQGFLIETGPNSALETTPLIGELMADLGLANEFLYANPAGKNRYILRDGVLRALPLSPFAFLTTRLFSVGAKFRLLKEPFIGRADKEESIAEFVTRRLGREFLDYAIDPFVAGVFAAKPDVLSVRSAFPKLYALEERYGGLIRGMLLGRSERSKRSEKAKDRAESFSFRRGMQEFPHALARGLGDAVEFDSKVSAIRDLARSTTETEDEPGAKRYEIEYLKNDHLETIEADAIVLAVPAETAAMLIQPFSPTVAHRLRSIHYPPVASVFAGFKRGQIPNALNGFGFLIPSREQRSILGCLWSSSLFPDRAPADCAALTVFVGGGRQPDLANKSEEELVALVCEELESIMHIQGKPLYWNVTKWRRAIPQYELGYQGILDQLADFETEHPGMFFCSNYRGGISVGDCVRSASATAEVVQAHIRRSSAR